jgi:cell division septation protein DedD
VAGRADPTIELQGTELVVGSTLDEIGLLVLSPAGGKAAWRSLRDVLVSAWESSVELPAFTEAHSVGGGSIVLLERDGEVSRFVPGAEAIEQLDRLEGDEVRWVPSDQAGAFVGEPGGEVIAVLPDRAWRYDVGSPVEWVGVVHDGVAVLLADQELRLLASGGDEAPAVTASGLRGPGLVTAWGRRLAFVDAEDGRVLRLLTVDPPENAGQVRLDGQVTVIAASPSSHELYAGLSDPPGVATVNRFSFSQKALTRLDRAPVDLRPSLFGDFLLAYDGERILRIGLQDGDVDEIPGEWSQDLPLGLQDGAVLTRRAGEVLLVDAEGRIAEDSLVGSSTATWLPIRWTPVARLAPEMLEGEPFAVAPGRPVTAAGERTAPPGEDRQAEPPETAADPPTGRPAAEDPGVPPGFYAIVGSARQREGIVALVTDLQGAGFPVQVQSTTDEAGETWYRGLVGPFDTRAGAEAASRQLQRERQMQSWVMGIGADG